MLILKIESSGDSMKPFTKYKGRLVCIMNDNIDTDILIPKQYLKSVKRTGFGDYVFAPWRYDENGDKIEDFPLNMEKYKNSSILVSGENFGCGSSREHAAWALQDYGINVVIAGGYSDIFYNNWLNNGHLAIVLDKEKRDFLTTIDSDEEIEIDLVNQKISAKDKIFEFDFPNIWKERLIQGKDSIDLTFEYIKEIEEYELKNHQ